MLSNIFIKIKKSLAIKSLKNKTQQGFTLLETLVAVFLLTLALTGPIYIATLAIKSSVESRDSISAYYLAEEAIEVVRNIRDTRAMNENSAVGGGEWLKDTSGSITGGIECFNAFGSANNICTMNRNPATGGYVFTKCNGGVDTCDPLSFSADISGGIIYGNSTGASATSKFSREVYFESAKQDAGAATIDPVSEVNFVVTIKWKDKGRDKQFKLVERLHNLQYLYYE